MRLVSLRRDRMCNGWAWLVCGCAVVAAISAATGLDAASSATAAGVGALFGALIHAGATHASIPRDDMPASLPGTAIERWRWRRSLTAVGALLVGAGCLVVWVGPGAVAVAGMLVGAGAVDVLSAAAVAAWERRHHALVLVDDERGTRDLYAGPAPVRRPRRRRA